MPDFNSSLGALNLSLSLGAQPPEGVALSPDEQTLGTSFANLLASLAPQSGKPMFTAGGKSLPESPLVDELSSDDVTDELSAAQGMLMTQPLDVPMHEPVVGKLEHGELTLVSDDSRMSTPVAESAPTAPIALLSESQDAQPVDEPQALGVVSTAASPAAVSAQPVAEQAASPVAGSWLQHQQALKQHLGSNGANRSTLDVTDGEADDTVSAAFETETLEPQREGTLNERAVNEGGASTALAAHHADRQTLASQSSVQAGSVDVSASSVPDVVGDENSESSLDAEFDIASASELDVAGELEKQHSLEQERLERLVFGKDSAQVGRSLGARMLTMIKDDIQEGEIHLDPPELGSLEVKVRVHQGEAAVQISASNAQVRDALEGQAFRLRESFADSGVGLSQFDVNDQSSGGTNDQSFGQDDQANDYDDGELMAEAPESPVRVELEQDGRLDTFA